MKSFKLTLNPKKNFTLLFAFFILLTSQTLINCNEEKESLNLLIDSELDTTKSKNSLNLGKLFFKTKLNELITLSQKIKNIKNVLFHNYNLNF